MVRNFSKFNFLKKKIQKIRFDFLKLIYEGDKYHIGGSLSCLDILVCIFYLKIVNLKKKSRNLLILSKGHALGILYAILLDKKLIKKKKYNILLKKNKIGGQLDKFNVQYVDWNTGSLGHSIGVCIGFALANPNKKIFTVIGDAEIDEGSVWEAMFFISEKKINNIHIIIDRNKLSASSFIEKKEVLDKKILNQLHFDIYKFNGHSIKKIYYYIKNIYKNNKSTITILNTIKGNGIKEFENNLKFSHGQPEKELLELIFNKNNIDYEKRH